MIDNTRKIYEREEHISDLGDRAGNATLNNLPAINYNRHCLSFIFKYVNKKQITLYQEYT